MFFEILGRNGRARADGPRCAVSLHMICEVVGIFGSALLSGFDDLGLDEVGGS